MEKAQGPIGVVVGFAILIIVFVIIGFAFKPSTTGSVVSEEKANFLNGPFELRAWVVNKDGVKLDIRNAGPRDYLINSLDVEGCGSISWGKQIVSGESRIFEVECSLVEGEEFSGKIGIVYSFSGREDATVEGNVRGAV
ncbi:MAG: hypothetical protein KJ718_06275 [Nanoarchaeota archaeon]|nr:hypothetical protein [Nanoarchaeota archaeon]MBU1052126.1 hypothetical protein [Nanoarchaeota archaeon]MBU1988046.1 hypothetical protein [Nanoarchaeota archaeon]